jgi:hypothetical protein
LIALGVGIILICIIGKILGELLKGKGVEEGIGGVEGGI